MDKLVITYKNITLLLAVACLLLLAACSDEPQSTGGPVQMCVSASWHQGRAVQGNASPRRVASTFTQTSIWQAGGGDINIDPADYPTVVNVHCSDGTDFTMTRGTACITHGGDWLSYTPSVIYKDSKIQHNGLTFSATATIDGGDELEGEASFSTLHDNHLQFAMHHTRALLRFAFIVDEKYDMVRIIKLTRVNLNGTDLPLHQKPVLRVGSHDVLAYAYIDLDEVSLTTVNTLTCDYDIYDTDNRDFLDPAHLDREVKNIKNTFTLSALKDGSAAAVTSLQAGYYYDLKVTIAPQYLYVLSWHDNKLSLKIE